MASLAPLITTTSVDSEGYVGDKEVEELLSEKLLDGYTLLDTACPKCVTPLLMKKTTSMALSPKRMQQAMCTRRSSSPHMMSTVNVQLQPSGSNIPSPSFEQPSAPITDVPYCVSCKAHVVTKESEIAILERNSSMKDRGSIIVAMEEDEREDANVVSPGRLAERNGFAERDSPEDGEASSDKENDYEEDSRFESRYEEIEQKEVEEPEEVAPVDDNSIVEEESPAPPDPPTEDVIEDQEDSSTEDVIEETEDDDEEEEELTHIATHTIASTVSPSMAAFLCASTASYQHVVPSPVTTPKTDSYVEEEGIEQELEDHSRYTEQVGSEAANSVLLPPKPTGSDLLQEGEKEELDHVRDTLSPRGQHAENDSQVSDGIDSTDEILQEYSVRRDIATKVLGAKMLQGYSLMETQCLKCGMPLMESSGQVDCVVCPVLVKKAKKKLKEQEETKALHAKKAMIEAEIAAKKKVEEEAAARAKAEQDALEAALHAQKAMIEAEIAAKKAEEETAARAKAEQDALDAENAAKKMVEEEVARAKDEQDALDAADTVEKEVLDTAEEETLDVVVNSEQEEPETDESEEQEGEELEGEEQEDGEQEWEEAEEFTGEISVSPATSRDDMDSLISFGAAFGRPPMYKPSFEEALRMEEEARLQEEERFLEETNDNSGEDDDVFDDVDEEDDDVFDDVDEEDDGDGDQSDEQVRVSNEAEKAAIDALRAAEEEEKAAMEALQAAEKECQAAEEEFRLVKSIGSDAYLAEEALRSAEGAKQEAMFALKAAEEEERVAKKLLQEAEEHEQSAAKALQAAEEEEQLALAELRSADEKERVEHVDRVRDLNDALRFAEEEEKAALRLLRAAEYEEKAAMAALHAAEEEERLAKELLQAKDRKRRAQEAVEQAELEELRALEILRAEERKLQEEAAEKLARFEEAEKARIAEIELAKQARLAEIEEAEKARREAEEEVERHADEKEARLLAQLEREAKAKTRAAEKAMLKAQAALNEVSSLRKQMYAKTIAQAEAEALAEVEAIAKAEAEDFKELPPSKSFIDRERWETLRIEGRSLMTRRVLQGWVVEKSSCKGVECDGMSLVSLNGKRTECTVCGGCGNGLDGAYQVEILEYEDAADLAADDETKDATTADDDIDASPSIDSVPTDCRTKEYPPETGSSTDDGHVVTSPSTEDASASNDIAKVEALADTSVPDTNPKADETSTVEVVASTSFDNDKESEAPESKGHEDWGINDRTSSAPNEAETTENGVADADAKDNTSEHSESKEGNELVASTAHNHREVIHSPRSPTGLPRSADIGPSFDECPASPTKSATRSVTELKEDFESKRNFVSKEIGRKMMKGWMLLDMSCPGCLMPLLSDPQIGQATCVLCGPTAKLPNVISTVTRHDPPVDPPSYDREEDTANVSAAPVDPPPSYDRDEDEEDTANVSAALSHSKSGLGTKASDLSQKESATEGKQSVQSVSKDTDGTSINIPLQLLAGINMSDEAALRKLIALVQSGQMAAEMGPTTESLSTGTAVITTSLENDDVSRITGVDVDTPINVASPRPPSGRRNVNVPDIVEEETGVEIMRMNSPREPFDKACGASPASSTKKSFFAGEQPAHSRRSMAHEHQDISSYKSLTVDTDDQSASSRHSTPHDVPQASSYKSLTVEEEMELYREFNIGQSGVQQEQRVSPMPSPLNKALPPRPAFRPLTPTSPSLKSEKRATYRGPPRPEDFGKPPSPAHARRPHSTTSQGRREPAPFSSRHSGHTRPHSTTSHGQRKYRRMPPPFPGSSSHREVPYLVGGHHYRSRYDDDGSIRSEQSYCSGRMVASDAYDELMSRIEECKRNLIMSDNPTYQANQAALLEKLGAAAVSMRKLEESG